MPILTITALKALFVAGSKPTELNFIDLIDTLGASVSTAADLAATPSTGLGAGDKVKTLGVLAAGDGGFGDWVWSPTSTATHNGGTIIKPTDKLVSDPGRWLRSFVSYVNALWFGPDPTGATDSTAALTAAIAASANRNLFIPSGTYLVSGSAGAIFTVASNMTIMGEEGTVISFPSVSTATLTYFQVAATKTLTMRDVTITGAASSGVGFTSIGILHAGTSGGVRLERVTITNVDVGLKVEDGALEVNTRDVTFSFCRSQGYLADSTGTPSSHRFTSCEFSNIGTTTLHHGAYIEAPFTNISFISCRFNTITGAGIHRVGGVAGTSRSFKVSTCDFKACGAGGGITVQKDSNTFSTAITNCTFDTTLGINLQVPATVANCGFKSGNGISVNGVNAIDGTITGCAFANNGYGVQLSDVGVIGWEISGNNFSITSADVGVRVIGAKRTNITGNVFKMASAAGVDVSAAADNLEIIGNTFFSGGGVYLRSTATDTILCRVMGNDFNGSSAAGTVEVGGSRWIYNSNTPTVTAGKTCFIVHSANGAPGISASIGSAWHRQDGGAATCLYIKESATDATGWTAK